MTEIKRGERREREREREREVQVRKIIYLIL